MSLPRYVRVVCFHNYVLCGPHKARKSRKFAYIQVKCVVQKDEVHIDVCLEGMEGSCTQIVVMDF